MLPSRRTTGLPQTVFSESNVDVHHIIRKWDWCVQLMWGDKTEKNEIGQESYVARMVAYRVLVGKPEGQRQLGRPGRRSEDNIKMDLMEVRCGGMDWTDLAQVRNR